MKALTNKTFVLDQIIGEDGHKNLYLLPYHCQLNAVQLTWSQAEKMYKH